MRLQRLDERLAAIPKPRIRAVDGVSLSVEDVLVVCAGFEDRSLAVLQNAGVIGRPPTVVLVNYLPAVVGNRSEDCFAACRRLGVRPVVYTYDREDPTGGGEEIWEKVGTPKGRVYVDISGMSRLLIVQILVSAAKSARKLDGLSILYSEAEHYFPSETEFNRLVVDSRQDTPVQFLSWGVSQITVVPELSSIVLQDQPTHLIAFPTLDFQQFSAVRKDVEPTTLTVVEGLPLHAADGWRTAAIRTLNRIDMIPNAQTVLTSTYDYEETLSILLDLYSHGGRLQRIVVAPTGSKMQTIAIGILRAFLTDVQIVYPTPRSFKTEAYTSGSRAVHRLDLDGFAAARMSID